MFCVFKCNEVCNRDYCIWADGQNLKDQVNEAIDKLRKEDHPTEEQKEEAKKYLNALKLQNPAGFNEIEWISS